MNSILSRLGGARTVVGSGGQSDTNYSATGDLPRPLDAKAFSKLYRRMDRVVKSLQNSRMNLSRSPPCMIDTLPDIYLKLKDINTYYELPDRKPILDQNDFFYITVNNIFDKCKRVNQLFKANKEDVYCDNSESRKQLVNLTIVIAYIYADLKAIFPDAQYDPHFRIAKAEAERWWKEVFPDRIIVPWSVFREQCCRSFPPLTKLEFSNLKSTIDLTCNDHVSIFEFDVFTRLFAPWSMLMKNFKKLTFHPGYMASATFENVKAILSKHKDKPGSYVFRMSCTKLGFWSIGYVTDHSEQRRDAISQIVVRDGKPIVEALVEGSQKGFYLYPNGDPTNPDLSDLLHVRPKPQFQVTEAQFEEYSLIGSTYQECKICNQRDKDVRLDLCGHFLCSKCLSQWLSKGTGCPFCRSEIRSTQSIVMQPFQSPSNSVQSNAFSELPPPKRESFSDDSVSRPPPNHPPPPLPPGFSESLQPHESHQANPTPRSPTRRKNSAPYPAPPNIPLPPTPPEPTAAINHTRLSQQSTSPTGSVNTTEDISQVSSRVHSSSDRPAFTDPPLPPLPSSASAQPLSPVPPYSIRHDRNGAKSSSGAQVSSRLNSSSDRQVFVDAPLPPLPSSSASAQPQSPAGAGRDAARTPPHSLPIRQDRDGAKPSPGDFSRSKSHESSTPGSVSSSTRSPAVEVGPPPPQKDLIEKRELEQLPPPPPPPLHDATSPGRPIPAPRRHHAQRTGSPNEGEHGRRPSVDPTLSSLPPPPPPPITTQSDGNSEVHFPRAEPYNTPLETPYNVPTDPYNVPSDPYNVPSDPYNVPTDPYNVPSDPYNVPSDPYNVPSDPYNFPSDPYNVTSYPHSAHVCVPHIPHVNPQSSSPQGNDCRANGDIVPDRVTERGESVEAGEVRNDKHLIQPSDSSG